MHSLTYLLSIPVSTPGQPWPRLCLHQDYIVQFGKGRLTFLSRFAHYCPALASRKFLRISGGQWLLDPKNCTNLSLGQQSFLARIVHFLLVVEQLHAWGVGLSSSSWDQGNLTYMHGSIFPRIEKGNMKKASHDSGSYFSSYKLHAKLFQKLSSKCCFFLDMWHAHHLPKT